MFLIWKIINSDNFILFHFLIIQLRFFNYLPLQIVPDVIEAGALEFILKRKERKNGKIFIVKLQKVQVNKEQLQVTTNKVK